MRKRERESRPGRIFKHDVAITSDQSGIFHPAPFIRRKRERRACATNPSRSAPSYVPHPHTVSLVRIINGQFAASAADCIVSLFSVARMAKRLSLFLASFPVFRPYSSCLAASTSSGFPSRSPSDRPFALSFLLLLLLLHLRPRHAAPHRVTPSF